MYSLANVDGYQYSYSDLGPPYVLDILPLSVGVAATSSDQRLRLFDPSSLSRGPLRTLQTSHGNITVARTFDHDRATLCTAGSNGTVTIWDVRAGDQGPAQMTGQIGVTQAAVGALSCNAQANLVAAGTEFLNNQASIIVWDIRSVSSPVAQYVESHSDDVTELNFHPTDLNMLLSGSTDGLVNVYDLRITDEDEAVVQTFNHGASIHHAGFLGRTEVFALSHDEKLALYDLAEELETGCAVLDLGDMRKVAQCQYVVDVLPKPMGGGAIGAVIGVGSHDQQKLELIHLSRGSGDAATWRLESGSVVGLPGAHGSELVRAFRVFEEERVVLTGGEDGSVKAWKPPV